jgi:hypothetical protein
MKQRIFIPKLILFATGTHLAIAGFTWTEWLLTGNDTWINTFFQYQGKLFFLVFSGLEAGLSFYIWRHFFRGDALRQAWLMISLSGCAHLVGSILTNLLGTNPTVTPNVQVYALWLGADLSEKLYRYGTVIGGPLQMLLLAIGLYLVIRLYKRLGMLARLSRVDYILFGIVLLYTLRFVFEVVKWNLESTDPVTVTKIITWTSDPLLSLLLLEAIFLRRSVISMGGGLIAKCWGAFTAGIFLTSLGDMGLWAISHGFLSWPTSSLTWYIWFLASAAYTLGPAYQVEALRRAKVEIPHPVKAARIEPVPF